MNLMELGTKMHTWHQLMPGDAGRWKKKVCSLPWLFQSKQEQETSQTQPLKHVDAAQVSGKQADIYTGLPQCTKFSDKWIKG